MRKCGHHSIKPGGLTWELKCAHPVLSLISISLNSMLRKRRPFVCAECIKCVEHGRFALHWLVGPAIYCQSSVLLKLQEGQRTLRQIDDFERDIKKMIGTTKHNLYSLHFVYILYDLM